MAAVGTLQEQALRRKEKLKAFREKTLETTVNTSEESAVAESEKKLPRPVFRSYQPEDESLKAAQVPKIKPLEVADQVKDQLAVAVAEPMLEEVDLVKLAPRKPDWDLKRDIAKKLEKLERRTQRTIAELIRERLQTQSETRQEDLALAVSDIASKSSGGRNA